MKIRKQQGVLLFLSIALSIFGLIWFPQYNAYAAHEVYLRDINGTPVAVGGNTPYSPKQSCGLVNCHIDMVKSFGLTSGNIYESGTGFAEKEEGGASYSVPYPLHGVSAGFHFQTGRSSPWGQTQRAYYNESNFTSSPGMYGKFCLSTSRQLAGLYEDDSTFDMSTYDFAHSGCAWCHAGGGPLEYDREGYRFDGAAGLFKTGFNPDPKKGDYYSFDLNSGSVVSKINDWQSGGTAEVDCLLCHLDTTIGGFRFSMLERNFALSEAGSPGLAASLGLAGPSGTTGFLTITRQGDATGNPDISQSGWAWTTNLIDITTTPDKANCALCHFADKSLMTTGPGNIPLGYTVMQKMIPAGTVRDGDIVGLGNNSADWKSATLRAESGKGAQSINDPANGDAHMDKGRQCSYCHNLLGTARDYWNDCVSCHYDMWGYPAPPEVTPVSPQVFPALSDTYGNIIQPAIDVFRIDHQFAKGNNNPDGSLMDQMDNTVTCENCHITRTHPNAGIVGQAGSAPNPAAAHAEFPAFHFSRIGCRTCHVPLLNGPVKRVLNDLTAGPYAAADRSQVKENSSGLGYRPLYVWKPGHLGASQMQIEPIMTLTTAFWADQSGDSAANIPLRTVQRAAEQFRIARGSTGGVYNWTLNQPQNGDIALIVNTPDEITGMVDQLRLLGASEPVLTMSFEQSIASHNTGTKSSGQILGSPAGGWCVMCHSSSDPASSCFSTRSVGFFDKKHLLFDQPLDGGSGIIQAEVNDAGGNPVKRVNAELIAKKPDGSPLVLYLAGADGETVQNEISQGDLFGFSPTYLATLLDPQVAGITKASAGFAWASDSVVSKQVNFNASSSLCSGSCAYTWNFGDGGFGSGILASHVYNSPGSYQATLTIQDSTYGFTSTSTVAVTATVLNTAPVASKTTPVVSGMTVSLTDTSTDQEDPQANLSVTVTWGDGSASTGTGGQTFTHIYAMAGTYTIRHSVTDTGGLASSSPNRTVTITAKYSIGGTVSDSAGNAVPGVTMYLKQGTTVKKTTTTGTAGEYSFTNLLTGCYIVQPSKTGRTFNPATRTVCVGPSASGADFTAQ